jgi:hypothetical protein
VTKTIEEKKLVNQQVISGRSIFPRCGSSSGGASLVSTIQVSTLCRGSSSTNFIMVGQDQTIRLPEL